MQAGIPAAEPVGERAEEPVGVQAGVQAGVPVSVRVVGSDCILQGSRMWGSFVPTPKPLRRILYNVSMP